MRFVSGLLFLQMLLQLLLSQKTQVDENLDQFLWLIAVLSFLCMRQSPWGGVRFLA